MPTVWTPSLVEELVGGVEQPVAGGASVEGLGRPWLDFTRQIGLVCECSRQTCLFNRSPACRNPTANLTVSSPHPVPRRHRALLSRRLSDRRGVRAAGVDPGGVPRGLERHDAAVRRLPGGVGLLADHRDGGLRRLRHRRARRAADRRIAVRPRRPPARAARRDRRPGRGHAGVRDGRRRHVAARRARRPGPARPAPPSARSAPACSISTAPRARSPTASRRCSASAAGALVASLLVQYLPDPTQPRLPGAVRDLRRPGGRRRA